MRNRELIKAIYDRCPDMENNEYTLDQLFDRVQDIKDMIERERPAFRKDDIRERPMFLKKETDCN